VISISTTQHTTVTTPRARVDNGLLVITVDPYGGPSLIVSIDDWNRIRDAADQAIKEAGK